MFKMFFVWFLKKFICLKSTWIFLTSGPRRSLWRVPWISFSCIFYAFQYHKNGINERLFDTMSFKLMKTWEKIVVYEFNISFTLIFREWKMVLSTLGIINFYLQYPIYSFGVFLPVFRNILLTKRHCYLIISKYRIVL